MTQRSGFAFSHDVAARGRALAEGRLAYLTELYDSGRWRRFFSEVDFLLNVREAKAALATWSEFTPRVTVDLQPHPIAPAMASEPEAPPMFAPVEEPVVAHVAGGMPPRTAEMRERDWQRLASLLPPVAFGVSASANDVRAERDLSEA